MAGYETNRTTRSTRSNRAVVTGVGVVSPIGIGKEQFWDSLVNNRSGIDVLQSLSPYMTVRSDTFTIRAYGEARNAATQEVEARAWCEALAQRLPSLLHSGDPMRNAEGLGRRFQIVQFRWLSAKEI